MKRYQNITIGGLIAVLLFSVVTVFITRDISHSLMVPLGVAIGWMIFYIFFWTVEGTVREALMEETK